MDPAPHPPIPVPPSESGEQQQHRSRKGHQQRQHIQHLRPGRLHPKGGLRKTIDRIEFTGKHGTCCKTQGEETKDR